MKEKIDNLLSEGFNSKSCEINGDECILIYPNFFSAKWNKERLIYRSSIWRLKDFHPISLSFKKFFNWDEKNDIVENPNSLEKTTAVEKIDGSTLIISKYKNEIITRTRESFTTKIHINGHHEIEIFKEKYPLLFNNDLLNSEEYSILTEWVSPNNIIVLNHFTDCDIYLTGIIFHKNYTYLTQNKLDELSKEWNIKRPEKFQFKNFSSMLEEIKNWKDKEGICLYFNKDQDIKKIKGLDYLARHSFKNEMNINNMLEIYISENMPDLYHDFLQKINDKFDFECAEMSKCFISKIIDSKKQCNEILNHMKKFIIPLQNVDRKEAALKIISSYGNTIKTQICFSLLDNKEINEKAWKKLLSQNL